MTRSFKSPAVLFGSATALLVGLSVAQADSGNLRVEAALRASVAEKHLAPGSAKAVEAVSSVVLRASELPADRGGQLVPAGTSVDKVEWTDGLMDVYLTIPSDGPSWKLTDLEAESFCDSLAAPFINQPSLRGVVVQAREGNDSPYQSLNAFLPVEPQIAKHAQPSEVIPAAHLQQTTTQLRGQLGHAARQPSGALSNVIIYASCGHGWTADNVDGDSYEFGFEWYTQRPVLHSMTEDHGNIDMLNIFVQHAFNAGATVVPFRPVGWQSIELVLDHDDYSVADGFVRYSGTWYNGSYTKYFENGVTNSGYAYRWTASSTTETAVARYTPNVTVSDYYPVYCFTIGGLNRTIQTYRIKHSGGIIEIPIDHRRVGNGWIWLGDYYLDANGNNYVEISNQSPESGLIIADGIRWGGGMGDIVRPGPGTISGFPRGEEAQRYWAESQLGNNAVGFDSNIWDIDEDDQSDNVRTGAKWAREMNLIDDPMTDRWRRIHIEFHTNATGGSATARGPMGLITTLGATTNQETYAHLVAAELNTDMPLRNDEFEHNWQAWAGGTTLTATYGAICTGANDNEFDATITELAFHDNEEDTDLLRDPRARSAMAKSTLQAIIRLLSNSSLTGYEDTEVPLAFPPSPPTNFRIAEADDGEVVLSWNAPISNEAYGDPATGYVVYASANGYGFGDPVTTNGLSLTISGLPNNETMYYRVSSTNVGGESLSSEVLTVRKPAAGTATVLIVNGFDRLRRQQNPVQHFSQPSNYAGKSIERQIWRRSNSADYCVQFAEALDATTLGFVSCSNEAIVDGQVELDGFDMVLWILGTESSEDVTLEYEERSALQSFLDDGGSLFISGADIGFDLIDQGSGSSFMQNALKSDYVANDAGTNEAVGSGGILSDIGSLSFATTNGAPYNVYEPDELSPMTGGETILTYVGGTGGAAAVQYDFCVYKAVTFGFPFETISSASQRKEIMERVVDFLSQAEGPQPFDYYLGSFQFGPDCDVDNDDLFFFTYCEHGPGNTYPDGNICLPMDGDGDADVDLRDFALFQQVYTGP